MRLEIFYHDFEENTDGWTAHGGSNASDGVFHIKDYTWPEFKFPVLQMGGSLPPVLSGEGGGQKTVAGGF